MEFVFFIIWLGLDIIGIYRSCWFELRIDVVLILNVVVVF